MICKEQVHSFFWFIDSIPQSLNWTCWTCFMFSPRNSELILIYHGATPSIKGPRPSFPIMINIGPLAWLEVSQVCLLAYHNQLWWKLGNISQCNILFKLKIPIWISMLVYAGPAGGPLPKMWVKPPQSFWLIWLTKVNDVGTKVCPNRQSLRINSCNDTLHASLSLCLDTQSILISLQQEGGHRVIIAMHSYIQ